MLQQGPLHSAFWFGGINGSFPSVAAAVQMWHRSVRRKEWFYCLCTVAPFTSLVAKLNIVTQICQFNIQCPLFKVTVLRLECPMDRHHNHTVNRQTLHSLSLLLLNYCIGGFSKQAEAFVHSLDVLIVLGNKPQSGGGVGRMLMPSKGKLMNSCFSGCVFTNNLIFKVWFRQWVHMFGFHKCASQFDRMLERHFRRFCSIDTNGMEATLINASSLF